MLDKGGSDNYCREVSDNSQVTSTSNFLAKASEHGGRNALGQLLPGKSGNPGGRPKSKMLRRHLLRSLLAETDGVKAVDQVTSALVAQGVKGNVHAFEAIRDTVDGRPSADNDGAGAGQPIVFAPVFMSPPEESK